MQRQTIPKVRRSVEIPLDIYRQLEARAERGAVNALIMRYIQQGLNRDMAPYPLAGTVINSQ